MDLYGDFGVMGAPQTAMSPELQTYVDALKAYEAQQRGAGFLVRPSSTLGSDYASLMASGVKPEDYYQTGYQFLTNAGKRAKAKANPSAQIFYDPNKRYVFENERKNHKGTDYSTFDVADRASFDRMYQEAQRLSQSQGKKANWRVFEVDPVTGQRTVVADDDPKGPLGKIADFALPALGALLMPVTGGLSAAAAAGLGAAGGSALSGIAQGKSIGSILKGAALSGGLSYLGGSLLNGAGGGSSLANSINNEALAHVAAINGAGAAGAGAAGAVGGLASVPFDGITVVGHSLGSNLASNAAAPWLAAGAAGAAGGLPSAGTPSQGAVDPATGEIVVSAAKPAGLSLGDVALGGAAVGLPATAAAAGSGSGTPTKSTAEKVVDYLRAAGLITGFVGDLFGGGGGGNGGRGNWTPGALNPVFSAQLPAAQSSYASRTPRTMTAQDWSQYGMRPEQSFWSDIEQRYTPPALAPSGSVAASTPAPSGLRVEDRYASGGRADDQIARVSEGEYIIDAETVALLGDGSNEAGARKLDDLRVNIRKAKGRNLAKGKISPDARNPASYMKGRK